MAVKVIYKIPVVEELVPNHEQINRVIAHELFNSIMQNAHKLGEITEISVTRDVIDYGYVVSIEGVGLTR